MRSQTNWHAKGFFGLHYDLHANENDTVLGKDATFEHIYAQLIKVRPDFVQYDCKGHPGYAGYPTKVGTPAPGIVGDALKVWRQVTRKLNIPLSVHYSGLWDTVAVSQHPAWARVQADGVRHKDRVCCNSAYVEELMIPQMLEVIDWYDVDGFWVDGDNWCASPCYCEACAALFEAETGIGRIPRSQGDPCWARWLAFHRESYEDYVREYTQAVHERKRDCLVCSNWMYSLRQPEEIRVPVDYLSGDFTPSFGCENAAVESRFLNSRGLSWNLMAWGFFSVGQPHEGWTYPGWTFKTGEHLKQEAAEVMANGGNLFIYDQPQRSGRLAGWHHDILAEVARFCRQRQPFCQGTASVPQVALLHDPADYYAKNEPLYNPGRATDALQGALQALLENHFHTDILNDATLRRRIGEYPLVVVPEPDNLSAEVIAACQDYVHRGGHLLVSGPKAPALFSEVLGIEPEGEPQIAAYALAAGEERVSLKGLWQMVRPKGASIVQYLYGGEESSEDRLEEPAATLNGFGKGKALGIFGPVFEYLFQTHYPRLRKWLGDILDQLNPPNLLSVSAPARVEISLRTKENKMLLHLVNRGAGHPLSARNHAVEDIPPVGPIKITIPVSAEPKGVYLAPEKGEFASRWVPGSLEVAIASLHIHSVLVVER